MQVITATLMLLMLMLLMLLLLVLVVVVVVVARVVVVIRVVVVVVPMMVMALMVVAVILITMVAIAFVCAVVVMMVMAVVLCGPLGMLWLRGRWRGRRECKGFVDSLLRSARHDRLVLGAPSFLMHVVRWRVRVEPAMQLVLELSLEGGTPRNRLLWWR